MIYGLDYLGGARYADLLFREHPAGWAAGIFANTFGDSRRVVQRLMDSGRCPRFRVHLLWSDTHTFGTRAIAEAVAEAKRWRAIVSQYKAAIQISPWCEHNEKAALLYKLRDAVLNVLPDCEYVNTPWKGDILRGVLNEIHGTHKAPSGPYLYSFDGLPCVDSDVQLLKETHSRSDTHYLWTSQFNGRKNPNDTTPRPQRKAWPTADLIDSVIYLHRDRGAVSIPRRWLWKSHADQHSAPKPEPRALKPVFIIPPKVKRVELVADNGQVVAISSAPSPFSDGRWRYYFSQYGYQIAEKARRIQGHSVCKLILDGKVRGTVNAAFRAGSFR
jgi:hypothetical protein